MTFRHWTGWRLWLGRTARSPGRRGFIFDKCRRIARIDTLFIHLDVFTIKILTAKCEGWTILLARLLERHRNFGQTGTRKSPIDKSSFDFGDHVPYKVCGFQRVLIRKITPYHSVTDMHHRGLDQFALARNARTLCGTAAVARVWVRGTRRLGRIVRVGHSRTRRRCGGTGVGITGTIRVYIRTARLFFRSAAALIGLRTAALY